MKIDKKMLDMLLKLNDEQLWATIKLVASHSGIEAVKDMERPKDMSGLRKTLSSLNDEDIDRAMQILGKGKKDERK